MTHTHLIHSVFSSPWLILPTAHHSIAELVKSRVLGAQGERIGSDVCGNAVELEQMEVIDGVARIPISGVIGRKLSAMEKGSGAVDVADIEGDIKLAESDPRVNAIVLCIDSPGGMVNGTPELASVIEQADKPIYAWVPGGAYSAAYWLACSTDGIFAAPSAGVGSIGVYIPHYDLSAMYDYQGIKADPITSGKYKAAGFPGTSLTEAQREDLQGYVDRLAAQFQAHVTASRGEISPELMQGQTFQSDVALENGLVDGIYRSLDEMIAAVV